MVSLAHFLPCKVQCRHPRPERQRSRCASNLCFELFQFGLFLSSFQETEDSTDLDTNTKTPQEMKCCLCDELFDTSEQSPKLPTGWQNSVCLDCRLGSLSDQTESMVKALSKPHADVPEAPSFKAKRSRRGRPDSAILCAECETKPAVIECTVCDETPYCQACLTNHTARRLKGAMPPDHWAPRPRLP